MPLFPRLVPHRHHYYPDPSHMDLSTLLSLVSGDPSTAPEHHRGNTDSYHHPTPIHGGASHHARPRSNMGAETHALTPKFDLFETTHEYILEGELPGLADKKAVEIEFTDDQTLLIKGRIEKKIEEATPSVPEEQPKQTAESETAKEEIHPAQEAKEEAKEETLVRPRTPPKPAYVEDSPDEDDVDYDDARRSTTILTPTSTVAPSPKQSKKEPQAAAEQQQKPQPQKKQQEEKPKIRYWVSERMIGSFQRAFSFPGLIDRDGVKAKLENGILTVVVPKRAKAPVKRIEVF